MSAFLAENRRWLFRALVVNIGTNKIWSFISTLRLMKIIHLHPDVLNLIKLLSSLRVDALILRAELPSSYLCVLKVVNDLLLFGSV